MQYLSDRKWVKINNKIQKFSMKTETVPLLSIAFGEMGQCEDVLHKPSTCDASIVTVIV